MSAIQCPDCDLRFASERDLDDHLKLDHPDFHVEPKSPEDALLMERRHSHRRHRPEPRNG
jgi:hypothetical protein